MGIGLVVFVVMAVWSVVLAARATQSGEFVGLPMVICLAALWEFSVPWVWFWYQFGLWEKDPVSEWITWLGLPVFAPFVAFASTIAGPVALWRVRRANGRLVWRGVLWYAGIFAALTVLVLPWPLFYFLASARLFCSREEVSSNWNRRWGDSVKERMPNLVRDAVEEWSESSSAQPNTASLLLAVGHVSEQRLLDRIGDPSRGVYAFEGLIRKNRSRATECAWQIGLGKVPAWNAPDLLPTAAMLLAENASIAQLRDLMDPSVKPALGFRSELMWRYLSRNACGYELGRGNPWFKASDRALGLRYLWTLYDTDEAQRRAKWLSFLRQPDAALRQEAAMCLVYDHGFELSLAYMDDPDPHVRLQVLLSVNVWTIRSERERGRSSRPWLRRLTELLDDDDHAVAFVAAYRLAILCDDIKNVELRDCDAVVGGISASKMLLETAETRARIEQSRKAVQRWVKEHPNRFERAKRK
ncbi:MAG TPA: hypothetical protein VGP72_02925 [Planctomycetota bacterium]